MAAFARTPALLNANDILDYTTTEGIAIYKDGTKSLLSDKKTKLEVTQTDKRTLFKLV